MDLRGLIPTIVHITEGKRPDVTFLDDLVLEPGAVYLMDRGYVDFARLHLMDDELVRFRRAAARDNRGRREVRRRYSPTLQQQAADYWRVRQRAGDGLRDVESSASLS